MATTEQSSEAIRKFTVVIRIPHDADRIRKGFLTALNILPPEERVALLIEAIEEGLREGARTEEGKKQRREENEKFFWFLKEMCNDRLAWRAFLRDEFYPMLSRKDFSYGNDPVQPKLRALVLEEILAGWKVRNSGLGSETPEHGEDAEVCFQFVCKVYTGTEPTVFAKWISFQKDIERVLRKCLGDEWENPLLLLPWMLKPYVPAGITRVLRQHIMDLEGMTTELKRVEFLAQFDLLHRSDTAYSFLQEYMERIRRTDEIAQKLVKAITPRQEGERPRYPFGNMSTHLLMSTPEHVQVAVRFEEVRGATRANDFSLHAASIREERDRILREIENPPTIAVRMTRPDGSLIGGV